jgi:hypothetical protein
VKKTYLQVIISKPGEDPVNDKRVVADEIAIVGLKSELKMSY